MQAATQMLANASGTQACHPQKLVASLNSKAAASQAERQGRSTTANTKPVTQDTVDEVFLALGQLYGSHWRRRCEDSGWGQSLNGQWACFDTKGEWLRALQHLSESHVRCGLDACNERAELAVAKGDTAWPPESAMLFAKLCRLRPEPLGLPSLEAAWRNVQEHAFAGAPFIHEGVAAAAGHVDLHNMRSATYNQLAEHRRVFKHYYASSNRDCVVERVARGETMRPQAAIGHDSQRSRAELTARVSAEQAAQRVAEAGLPHRMNASQGLAALKAAAGRA